MSKYYNDSQIQDLMNEEINIKIIGNYIYASKLFNDKYKNTYKIRVFIDFNFLNIILDNLQNEISFKVQILNNEINDLFPEEILTAYEELELIREVITLDYSQLVMKNVYLHKENKRLNNVINELEKELDRGYLDLFEHELVPGRELITNIKNYLGELKGSDKE